MAFEAHLDSLTADTLLLNNFVADDISRKKISHVNQLLIQKTNLYAELMSLRYTQVLTETFTTIDSLQQPEFKSATRAERRSFFDRLFRAKKIREQQYSDSIALSENRINNLKAQLKQVSTKGNEQLKVYSEREMLLLREDEKITVNLQTEIGDLQRMAVIRIADNVSRVKNSGEDLREQLLFLTIGGIVILFFLMGAIYRDMHKARKARISLEYAKSRAEQLTKVKEDFLSDMSHEIRSPLSAIYGLSSILLKQPSHVQREDFVNSIHQSSAHLLSLLNNVLDEASLQSGNLRLSVQLFYMQDVSNDVNAILFPKANEKKLQLVIKNAVADSVHFSGDVLRLKQILLNLTGNAIKYTEKGTVVIHCSFLPVNEQQGILEIKVVDTGIGISKKQQEKLFSRFDNNESLQSESTGLGLYITKSLVELLNGSIDLISSPGKGTDITLKIPYAYELKADEIKPVFKMKANLSGASILVVDDDEWNRYVTKEILKEVGAKPDVAIDGARALEKIGREQYDIILLDLLMPVMSGQEVLMKIREKFPHAIVIALTADLLKTSHTQLIASGFTDALLKPLAIDQLSQILMQRTAGNENIETNEMIFDLTALKQLTKDDSAALVKFINLFLKNTKGAMEDMQHAYHDENPIEMGKIAHRMIPSCKQFKILTVVDILEEMNIWKTEPPHSSQISPAYNNLLKAVNVVVVAIENYLKQLHK